MGSLGGRGAVPQGVETLAGLVGHTIRKNVAIGSLRQRRPTGHGEGRLCGVHGLALCDTKLVLASWGVISLASKPRNRCAIRNSTKGMLCVVLHAQVRPTAPTRLISRKAGGWGQCKLATAWCDVTKDIKASDTTLLLGLLPEARTATRATQCRLARHRAPSSVDASTAPGQTVAAGVTRPR